MVGWQLPDKDPCGGSGLFALPAGNDAGPQPDHTHPGLCIYQPLCPCCTVSDNFICFPVALRTPQKSPFCLMLTRVVWVQSRTQCLIYKKWFVDFFSRHLHNNHIQSMGSRCFEGLHSLETLWVPLLLLKSCWKCFSFNNIECAQTLSWSNLQIWNLMINTLEVTQPRTSISHIVFLTPCILCLKYLWALLGKIKINVFL